MKKNWKGLVMSTLLAGVLLAGCSSNAPAADSAKGGKDLIGVAIYKFDDTFISGVRSAITKAAEGKAQLEMVDSQNSQPTQNDKVDLFINKKVKALAINPVDRNAAGVIIEKAKKANIPVVFFNREPLTEDMNKWDKVYYVGAKAEQSGIMAGQLVVEYFKANPDKIKNNTIRYVMLKG